MKIVKRTFISDFLLSCNDVFMMLLYCEILEIKKNYELVARNQYRYLQNIIANVILSKN